MSSDNVNEEDAVGHRENSVEGPKRKLDGTSICVSQGSTKPQRKKLRVVLSNNVCSVKEDNIGDDKIGIKLTPAPFQDEDKLHDVNELCKKLEDTGKHILVMVVDSAHSQWFGSEHGLAFARDHVDVISSFFNYCKDRNRDYNGKCIKKDEDNGTTCKKVKTESDTGSVNMDEGKDGVEVTDTCIKENVHDDNGEDNAADDDNEGSGDEDDDFDDGEDDADDEDNDDDQPKSKQPPKQNTQNSKRKEIFFQELAVTLQEAEETREVSAPLMKSIRPGCSKPACHTVEDLNRGKYECSTCGYKFLWKCHLELHQIKNPHCSRVRNLKMSRQDVLKESITFLNPDTGVEITSTFKDLADSQTAHPITCAVCKKGPFRDRGMLLRHVITHNRKKTYECNICCAGFSVITHLSTHLKDHFRKPFECQKCLWRFTNPAKLQKHTANGCRTVSLIMKKEKFSEFDITEYQCRECSVGVTGIGGLREHLALEHSKQLGEFDCVLCYKVFPSNILYKGHLLTHKKNSPCPFCPKKFGAKSDAYYRHVKSHGTASQDPLICDICGEQFRNKRYLETHRRKHTGERPFICEEEGCDKAFRSRDGLDQHKWTHKNQHFLCDFCGRKFKKPSFLRNHRRSHTVEWRYPCIYCPEKFRALRHFKYHLAKNHPRCVEEVKEKFKIILHPCNLCPKVFHEKEDHTAHMCRHNGIKPFPCGICGKGFSDKSNLLQHQATHSGGKRLKCNWCSRRFNEEKYLQSHVERIHTGKQETSKRSEGNVEDADELREKTLQIIEETIRGKVTFEHI